MDFKFTQTIKVEAYQYFHDDNINIDPDRYPKWYRDAVKNGEKIDSETDRNMYRIVFLSSYYNGAYEHSVIIDWPWNYKHKKTRKDIIMTMAGNDGDYVIRDENGKIYVMRKKEFEKKFSESLEVK